jgi:hypothetical protein
VIHERGELERVDRELDIHVALDLAAPARVHEFLGWLRHHPVAVVIEPVDKRPDRRIFLILDDRRIIEGANQVAPALELFQKLLVVDVEAERFRRRIKVCAVNEEGDSFLANHDFVSETRSTRLGWRILESKNCSAPPCGKEKCLPASP